MICELTNAELHARRLTHCGPLIDDYTRDRLSSKAFRNGGRLCLRCCEVYTVSRSNFCPTCWGTIEAEKQAKEAARLVPPIPDLMSDTLAAIPDEERWHGKPGELFAEDKE